MSGSLWPVQAALVTRWKADAGVVALVGTRIFDGQAKQGAARPYVVLRGKTETPSNTLGRVGWQDTVTTVVVSDYAGDMEALAIVAALDAALAAPLAVEGFGLVRARREFLETTEDGGVRNGVARYRFRTLATA